MSRPARAWLVGVAIAVQACGGGGPALRPPRTSVAVGAGRPLLSVVERDGDPRGAIAVTVSTSGIAPERAATVAVALGALVEERLGARGITEAAALGGWDGWRLRVLVASGADAARVVDALRDAMLAPVPAQDPALPAVARKVAALARRPLPDPVLVDVARCTGEAYGAGNEAAPTAGELEAWRRDAHGLGRVAVAAAGDATIVDGAAAALTRGPAWPRGAPLPAPAPWPAADAPPVVYDASGELAPGGARFVVTARTASPERAVAASHVLGDPRGPLASRLAALDVPARVRSVVGTAHVDGGCVAVTVDVAPRDASPDAAARVATAAALARQELAVEVGDVEAPPDLGSVLAARAPDPRDAAELSAWWRLAGRRPAKEELSIGLIIGVADPRDSPAPPSSPASPASPAAAGAAADPAGRARGRLPALGDAIRAEVDRAAAAWRAPVVEARTRVERGQGELWVLLASPCGTIAESARDAGAAAAVAVAAATHAASRAGDARVEPFVAPDGIGVLAHGSARAAESPQALARRLADAAARAFAADVLDAEVIARARTALLARLGDIDERALASLGAALTPNHPSWVDPLGTSFGLASASDEAIAMRAAALRAGPLRVAVVANADAQQAAAAVQAVDRWIARRPGEARVCPPLPGAGPARVGTYAVDLPAGADARALLAVPVPANDPAARAAARWTAAALDGPGGLLARALGGPARGDDADSALATSWNAAVVGDPRAPAIVVRLTAPDAQLDAAVAQSRALLDRLRRGALRDEDRARAAAALARAATEAALDPRARAIELWRGDPAPAGAPAPSLDALRSFASSTLRDDALVIVAARPAPRLDYRQ